jgi:protein gp37
MGKTTIAWTDQTWNPTRGCDKISPGCRECYAEKVAERFEGVKGHAYEEGFKLRLVPHMLEAPLHWRRPQRVFVNSMSDLFHEGVPFDYIDKVFAIMARCPQHTFQVLTKRSARMGEYCDIKDLLYPALNRIRALAPAIDVRWPLPNVILGVSAENQEYANKRIPEAIIPLLDAGWKTMISAEPLLGPIVFKDVPGFNRVNTPLHRLWVIVGGESGNNARRFEIEWAHSIVDQCHLSGVRVFVKQLGARPFNAGNQRVVFKSRKGDDIAEWPSDLRFQEFL